MYFIKLPGSECFARSTFVLDQHRYRSEFRDGHIDQFPHVILLRDIDRHIFCLRSHITQHLFGGFPMSPAAPREDDLGTVRGEALRDRSEEHTSELQSLMRISYAVFCLKKKNTHIPHTTQ